MAKRFARRKSNSTQLAAVVRASPVACRLRSDDPSAFLSPPSYFPDFGNIINGRSAIQRTRSIPRSISTVAGQPAAAYFVNTNVTNKGLTLSGKPFLLDTGADISVVSEINAVNLGFDPMLDTPDFTENVLGSGGTLGEVARILR